MEQKNLNRLRVIIAEKNLTNKWLSEQLGVGQPTVSKWVQNNAQPNLEMLIKISKILNVDINDLIRPDEVQLDIENKWHLFNIGFMDNKRYDVLPQVLISSMLFAMVTSK